MSRIGKQPVAIPAGVTMTKASSQVTVKGPKGELVLKLRPEVDVQIEKASASVNVVGNPEQREVRAYHGLTRALLSPASLWLIDEPLSSLDPTRARQAIGTLVDEAHARGVTLVATLHQVDVALERFARIVGLKAGQVAFDLPAAAVSRDLLATLYGSEFEQLDAPAAPDFGSATGAQPVTMHCR